MLDNSQFIVILVLFLSTVHSYAFPNQPLEMNDFFFGKSVPANVAYTPRRIQICFWNSYRFITSNGPADTDTKAAYYVLKTKNNWNRTDVVCQTICRARLTDRFRNNGYDVDFIP